MFQARRFENRESDITSQNNYKLLTENTNRSPFGFIAQFLKKNMQYIKKKTDSKPLAANFHLFFHFQKKEIYYFSWKSNVGNTILKWIYSGL